ncbi:MAG TPA: dienelactone hydrolase family protein [Puia sp.]
MSADHLQIKNIVSAGKNIQEAGRVLIMMHGRGATAESILSLAGQLRVNDFALIAPQALNRTWYPYSFMATPAQNEPALSASLSRLKELLNQLNGQGISSKNIYFLGFSQGASLILEFACRNATRYGGIVAFTGGQAGDQIYSENYTGNFDGTPVFLGTSDPDQHVPVIRVNETATILQKMNAAVTKKLYPYLGHTINSDEMDSANRLIFDPET